jgi:hypothetical protein
MLQEGSEALAQWPDLASNSAEGMKDAKRIAVAAYRHVLEDGPDKCSSESDAEPSDHEEQWSYADMYTPEMLGPDGKLKTNLARLTTDHANALRARGRAGCLVTVS